jgi:bacteriorhodopsin
VKAYYNVRLLYDIMLHWTDAIEVFIVIWYNVIGVFIITRVNHSTSDRVKYILAYHAGVCMINSLVSFASILDLHVAVINGRTVYFLRYIEWTLCTPIMSCEMCQSAQMLTYDTIIIVILTLAFSFCGSIASLTRHFWAKTLLGFQGTAYAMIVIYKLLKYGTDNSVNNTTLDDHLLMEHRINKMNIMAAAFIWPMYVISWALGPDVFGIISGYTEWMIENVLSITLKTICSSYALLTYNYVDVEDTMSRVTDILELVGGIL